MTKNELLRIVVFLEKVRGPYLQLLPFAEEDAAWNIVIAVIRAHLLGDDLRISALASEAKIPYATAMRKITNLINTGFIDEVPVGKSGRSFRLVPSEKLYEDFLQFARTIKSLLAATFGLRQSTESDEDYYLGGVLSGSHPLPPPQLASGPTGSEGGLRFLLNDDNYFRSMRNMWADFRFNLGSQGNFELLEISDLYSKVWENAKRQVSAYDIVSVDMPWLGEVAQTDAFRPLDDFIAKSDISALDFNPAVWGTGTWNKKQYGVPGYCTIEVLAARADWFEQEGVEYPSTFEETLSAAQHFHRPEQDRYGIVWNAAAGRPIAQTFMFLLACCGRNIVDTPKPRFLTPTETIPAKAPTIVSDASFAVLDYLHRLKGVSPPQILDVAWDDRTRTFLSGRAAMSYCWTFNAAQYETDLDSKVRRRVKYLQQPRGPSGSSINPIGGYLLCVPSNLPEDRAKRAFEAIAWMTSTEAMKAHARDGFPLAPRFSVSSDAEVAASSPIVSFIEKLGRKNLLSTWPRPPIPQYAGIETVLGIEIHRALRREIDDRTALTNAQTAIERMFPEHYR